MKKRFEPVQKTGNLKINPSMGPVHIKSTRPKSRFQFQIIRPLGEHKILTSKLPC